MHQTAIYAECDGFMVPVPFDLSQSRVELIFRYTFINVNLISMIVCVAVICVSFTWYYTMAIKSMAKVWMEDMSTVPIMLECGSWTGIFLLTLRGNSFIFKR